jgi:hypothetical protein
MMLDEDDLGSYRLLARREAGIAITSILLGSREQQEPNANSATR